MIGVDASIQDFTMDQELSSTSNGSSHPIPGLPSYLTSFLGREDDIALLGDLLLSPTTRLVTITGFGGIGKTRLAVEVVGHTATRWKRIWFISLAHVHEPTAATSLISRELGLDAADAGANIAIRHDLQTSSCLLVLDNFEHLVDVADHVGALLQTWPRLAVLVTSRSPLNLSAEQVFPLTPLSTNAGDGMGDAVQLFVDRARSRGASLMPYQTEAIAQICKRLEGIPLAIELAAARSLMLPPASMLDQLSSQLSLLTGGPRDAPARQRTLRDTIAWSYDLLAPANQQALDCLSVFSGGFTIAAASAVLDIPEAACIDQVSTLLACNLVQPAPSQTTTTPRYRLLDPVLEFAFEQLSAADRARDIRLAHARYFTALAEDSLPLYDGPELLVAMRNTAVEMDNLLAAINWSLNGGDVEDGVRLAGALWRLWHSSLTAQKYVWLDRVAQGMSIVNQALPCIEGLQVEAVTELLSGASNLSTVLGNTEAGAEFASELWSRASTVDYDYGKYWALMSEAHAHYTSGDINRAITQWEQCMPLAPTIRNPDNHMALALLSVSMANAFIGRRQESSVRLASGLELARACGNPTMICWGTLQAGQEARSRGEFQEALALLRETVALSDTLQHDTLAVALVSIARIAIACQQPDLAIELLGYSILSPFPEDQRELEEALAELRKLAGNSVDSRIDAARRNADPDRIQPLLHRLEEFLDSTTAAANQDGPLSARELEVILLLVEGCSNRAIAGRLFISERTVENHIQHIFAKLNVSNRAAAAAWAVRHNLS